MGMDSSIDSLHPLVKQIWVRIPGVTQVGSFVTDGAPYRWVILPDAAGLVRTASHPLLHSSVSVPAETPQTASVPGFHSFFHTWAFWFITPISLFSKTAVCIRQCLISVAGEMQVAEELGSHGPISWLLGLRGKRKLSTSHSSLRLHFLSLSPGVAQVDTRIIPPFIGLHPNAGMGRISSWVSFLPSIWQRHNSSPAFEQVAGVIVP
jgi:hypothetical protein